MIRSKSVFVATVIAILVMSALASGSSGAQTPAAAPAKPAPPSTTPAATTTPAKQSTPVAPSHGAKHMAVKARAKLDLNSASKEELTKLPGVDEMIADRIIAARPFKSKAELLSKSIVDRKEYNAIATRVAVKSKHLASATSK